MIILEELMKNWKDEKNKLIKVDTYHLTKKLLYIFHVLMEDFLCVHKEKKLAK